MAELRSELLGELSVDLEEPLEVGATPHGVRRIYGVKGGTFKGPKLKGKVLPTGGDWLLIRPDGAGELDVRATLRTDDGHIIYTYYRGILHGPPEVAARILRGETPDPSEYYFRTTPCFETGSEKYGWLNRTVAVGVGKVGPNWVGYTVYAIL
jgi:Protein of unknown function (DUF3237)